MAGSVNKVILVGNLGKDPEIRRTQDGRPIANLSVATSESWRDKATGERKEKTEWHRVVIFNEGLCKIAEQYLKKGAKVYSRARCRPANGPTRTESRNTRPRWCCRASTRSSPCSTAAAAAAASVRIFRRQRFRIERPERGGARKPAMAGGGGGRGDMDDEIPF